MVGLAGEAKLLITKKGLMKVLKQRAESREVEPVQVFDTCNKFVHLFKAFVLKISFQLINPPPLSGED